jgi:CYTH domain-containing protein
MINNLKKYMAVLAGGLCLAPAYATDITGRALDAATRQPVAGAVVTVKNTATGVITDGDGNFLLRIDTPLPVTLAVSLLGYYSQEVVVTDAGESVTVQLVENVSYLNISSVTLQNIQDEWEYEFQYEQHRWLNLTRWKNLITTVRTLVPTYTYYDDKFADANNVVTVNEITHKVGTTFARYHNHLKNKFDNIKGRNYRFPIPQGASFQDLGIRPQNPGYGEPVGN